MAQLKINGKSYDLAIRNMAVVRKEEEMASVRTLSGSYVAQWEFIKMVLKEEDIMELFGSLELEEVPHDLNFVTYVCNAIDDAYMEQITRQQAERANKAINIKAIDKFIQTGEAISKIENLKK